MNFLDPKILDTAPRKSIFSSPQQLFFSLLVESPSGKNCASNRSFPRRKQSQRFPNPEESCWVVKKSINLEISFFFPNSGNRQKFPFHRLNVQQKTNVDKKKMNFHPKNSPKTKILKFTDFFFVPKNAQPLENNPGTFSHDLTLTVIYYYHN